MHQIWGPDQRHSTQLMPKSGFLFDLDHVGAISPEQRIDRLAGVVLQLIGGVVGRSHLGLSYESLGVDSMPVRRRCKGPRRCFNEPVRSARVGVISPLQSGAFFHLRL